MSLVNQTQINNSITTDNKRHSHSISDDGSSSSSSEEDEEEYWFICLICYAAFQNDHGDGDFKIIQRHIKRSHVSAPVKWLTLSEGALTPLIHLQRLQQCCWSPFDVDKKRCDNKGGVDSYNKSKSPKHKQIQQQQQSSQNIPTTTTILNNGTTQGSIEYKSVAQLIASRVNHILNNEFLLCDDDDETNNADSSSDNNTTWEINFENIPLPIPLKIEPNSSLCPTSIIENETHQRRMMNQDYDDNEEMLLKKDVEEIMEEGEEEEEEFLTTEVFSRTELQNCTIPTTSQIILETEAERQLRIESESELIESLLSSEPTRSESKSEEILLTSSSSTCTRQLRSRGGKHSYNNYTEPIEDDEYNDETKDSKNNKRSSELESESDGSITSYLVSSTKTNIKSKKSRITTSNKYVKEFYCCLFCPCKYTTWTELLKHTKEFRTSGENDNAGPEETNNADADQHEEVRPATENSGVKDLDHQQDKFSCPSCTKSFQILCEFNTHILSAHPPAPTQHNGTKCRTCGKMFKQLRILREHVELVHRTFGTKAFLCSTCGQSFKKSNSLKCHIARAHDPSTSKHTCNICGRPCVSTLELENHLLTHQPTQTRYLCSICGASLKTKLTLEFHVRRHSDARPFKCNQCTSSFKIQQSLTNQMTGIHSASESKLECPQCDKVFKRRKHLVRHHKVVHLGLSKTHICSVCGVGFELKSMLSMHLKRVHAEPNHECKDCGKKFKSEFSLKNHSVVHDDSEAAFKFNCKVCGKKFKLKTHLIQHSTSHQDETQKKHVCLVCGKRFGLPAHLRQHEVTHNPSPDSKVKRKGLASKTSKYRNKRKKGNENEEQIDSDSND